MPNRCCADGGWICIGPIEPQFYALFGDYQTGIDEPELARYQRSFNGIKAE